MSRFEKRDPKTKEDFVNRILSYDFDGDIRHLGSGDARLERTGNQAFRIHFPDSGKTFELVVRIPRDAPAVVRQTKQEVTPRHRPPEERSFSAAPGSEEAPVEEQPTKRRYVRRAQREARG